MDYCYQYIEIVPDVVRLSDDLFYRPKLAFELRQFYCNSVIYTVFCRSHFTLTSWPMNFLLMDYCYQCIEVVQDAVCLSDDPFIWPKLLFELRQFYCNNLSYILCFVDRTSPWLFDRLIICLWLIVTIILKLYKTSSICPIIRLFGQNQRLNLANISAISYIWSFVGRASTLLLSRQLFSSIDYCSWYIEVV